MGNIGSIQSRDDAVSVACVQFPAKCCAIKAEVMENVGYICARIDAACRGYPGLDLIVFSEYSTQGLHPDRWYEMATTIPGPETERFSEACRRNKVWGHFSIMELNYKYPDKNPFNTAIIINPEGEVVLKYHKVNPWCPKEPWYPGNEFPVCQGPKGSTLGVIICYDGQLPETAREVAFKGADILIRGAGYMDPWSAQWDFVNRARAWENLMYVVACNMVGVDLQYSYFGKSMIVNFDGNVIVQAGVQCEQIITASLVPSEVRKVREQWTAENHLYNLCHRGYTALPGGTGREGAQENPYSYWRNWR